MNILKLKANVDFELLKEWCLTTYDYLLGLHSDFSLETEWFTRVIVDADKKKGYKNNEKSL